jgi:TPR repeat protein
MDYLGITLSPEVEMASYAINSVPILTGLVYFVLDYQLLKRKCDFYVLQAKRSSLEDCREYFLREPSSYLEYTKIIYSRMIFDIISVFYDPDSQVKENEMLLCASWSIIIFLYLVICQKVIFMCILVVYIGRQCYLSLSGTNTLRPTTDISDEYCRDKYELLKEACSGNLKSFETLLTGADNGEHISAGFAIFVLTSNESNIEPDIDKATDLAHENLDVFINAADKGDIFAQATMAFLFMRGLHVPKDDVKALQYGLKAIKTGHPYANLILGWVYLAREKKDPEQSYKYLKLAAKQGLASAQNSMGALNLIDNDKYKTNPKKALYWFKQAALQNLRGAEYNLGALYNSDLLLDCEPRPSFFSFGGRSEKQVREGLRNDAVYWLMLASQHGHRLADAELRKAEHKLNDL